MKRWMIGLSAALLLVGCNNQTSIQRSYISERNDCQSEAEDRIGDYEDSGDATDVRRRNAKLVTMFSDCMFEYGWTVAAPEREEAQGHTDTSVGVGDTIKPGKDVAAPQRAGYAPAAAPAPAVQYVPVQAAPAQIAPVQAAPVGAMPPPPPGYEYRLVPVAPMAAPVMAPAPAPAGRQP